jgi:hypothetical protein
VARLRRGGRGPHAVDVRSRPSPVRARMSSRSNSARPARTVSIRRPCALVVSAHVSRNDRKPAPLPPIAARVLRRSRIDLASRSSRVTRRTSPSLRASSARFSPARSVRAPLTFSRTKVGQDENSAASQCACASATGCRCQSALGRSILRRQARELSKRVGQGVVPALRTPCTRPTSSKNDSPGI